MESGTQLSDIRFGPVAMLDQWGERSGRFQAPVKFILLGEAYDQDQ